MNNTSESGKGQAIYQEIEPMVREVKGEGQGNPNTKAIKAVEQVSEETMPELLSQKKDDIKRTIFF